MAGEDDEIEEQVDSGWGEFDEPSPPTRSMNTAQLLEQLRASRSPSKGSVTSEAVEPPPPTPRRPVAVVDFEPEPATRRANDAELLTLKEQALESSRRPTPIATPIPPSPSTARLGNRQWGGLAPKAGATPADHEAFARPTPQAMPATRISSSPPVGASGAPPRPTPPPPGQGMGTSLRISGEARGQSARLMAQRKATKLNLSVQSIAAELEKAATDVAEPAPSTKPRAGDPAADSLALSLDDLDLGDLEPPAPLSRRSLAPRAPTGRAAPKESRSLAPAVADLDDLDLDALDRASPDSLAPPPSSDLSAPDSLAPPPPASAPFPEPEPLGARLRAPRSSDAKSQPATPPRVGAGSALRAPPGGRLVPPGQAPAGARPTASVAPAAPARPGGGLALPPLRPVALAPGHASLPKLDAARPADPAPPRASSNPHDARLTPPGDLDLSAFDRSTPLPDVPGPRDSLMEGSPLLDGLHIEVKEEVVTADEAAAIAALDDLDLSIDVEVPAPERPANPPPERRSQVEVLSAEDEALLSPIVQRFEKGDYLGTVMRAEGLLEERPDFEAARRYLESATEMLHQMYLSRLGDGGTVLSVCVGPESIQELSLDHRAGFLISLVDGVVTIDELVDMSGMPPLDVLRLLFEMKEQGVLSDGGAAGP